MWIQISWFFYFWLAKAISLSIVPLQSNLWAKLSKAERELLTLKFSINWDFRPKSRLDIKQRIRWLDLLIVLLIVVMWDHDMDWFQIRLINQASFHEVWHKFFFVQGEYLSYCFGPLLGPISVSKFPWGETRLLCMGI